MSFVTKLDLVCHIKNESYVFYSYYFSLLSYWEIEEYFVYVEIHFSVQFLFVCGER